MLAVPNLLARSGRCLTRGQTVPRYKRGSRALATNIRWCCASPTFQIDGSPVQQVFCVPLNKKRSKCFVQMQQVWSHTHTQLSITFPRNKLTMTIRNISSECNEPPPLSITRSTSQRDVMQICNSRQKNANMRCPRKIIID